MMCTDKCGNGERYGLKRAFCCAVLVFLMLLWSGRSALRAVTAGGSPASIGAISSHCLTAGDLGPYFCQGDLPFISPLNSMHVSGQPNRTTWTPGMYPTELSLAYVPYRVLSFETVRGLATHEIVDGDHHRSFLAITFDCEADPQSTWQILDTLRRENVRATFFFLGWYAYMVPGLVRQTVQDGHELGSHGFTHLLFTRMSPLTVTLEVRYTEAVMRSIVGEYGKMRYFRFPHGKRNQALLWDLASLGYQSVTWTLDPGGWREETTVDDMVAYVEKNAHWGSILSLHCREKDAQALAAIIRAVRNKGLLPCALTDVLKYEDREALQRYPGPSGSGKDWEGEMGQSLSFLSLSLTQ